MPRRKLSADTLEPPATVESFGHLIHPSAVYLASEVRRLLRLRESSLRREIREGRLRVVKRCGRYYFLGEQLLEWLSDGELRRRPEIAARNGTHRDDSG